ncbi:MAG: hypothetical protein V4709_05185 [Pseudomonadota bacterium]
MRLSALAAVLATSIALPAAAQVVVLPVLTPGGPLAAITTQVFSALPAPLTTSAPLPLDLTVLENGANGSGINQVLGLGGNNVTSTLIGNQLNNTLVTPLLGLPRGTAQPIDVAVLGGDGVGNSNAAGVLGAAVLSGSNVANGGLVGLGVLNENNSGNGQLLGVAALSGTNSGNASQGLGVGVLNRGETLGVSAAGARVLTLEGLAGQARGALPGLDQGGLAVGGGTPVTSSNPLLNLGLLAGDGAGSGGALGVAALSGNGAANAQLVGVGVLNQSGSAKAPVGVDVLSGSGSGVSSNGVGVAVLSGDNSGVGGVAGVGALTGSNSGTGGTLGAGVLSGAGSGKSPMTGLAALSGAGSGSGGALGGNVAGVGGGGAGNGSGTGNGNGGVTDGNLGNGATSGGSSSTGSGFTYTGDGSNVRLAGRGQDVCKLGYKDANGRVVRPEICDAKLARKG